MKRDFSQPEIVILEEVAPYGECKKIINSKKAEKKSAGFLLKTER